MKRIRHHRQQAALNLPTDPATLLTEADQLQRRIDRLRLDVERRLADIGVLRASETYQTLAAHVDWDAYFADARQRLEEECAELRRKLEEDEDDR